MQPPDTLTNEQINDLPLLWGLLEQMGLREQIDTHVSTHGAWQGVSLGTLTCVWLCYVLSQRDHRLMALRPWADQRQQTLTTLLGTALRDTDCTDDRLALLVSKFGDTAVQATLDTALLQQWMRVYRLPTQTVRLDSTSVSVYHPPGQPESLLQLGHSKDHRPDLAQFKTMLATLDPLGLPVCMQMVAGNDNDDGLYVPAYQHTVKTLGTPDLLFVGDSKMGALKTRATLVGGQSRYLCSWRPANATQQIGVWVEEALHAQPRWQTIWEAPDKAGNPPRLRAQIYCSCPILVAVLPPSRRCPIVRSGCRRLDKPFPFPAQNCTDGSQSFRCLSGA